MPEIELIPPRSIILLKLALSGAEEAVKRLNLAPPLTVQDGEPATYWYGPDCWYLDSEERPAAELIEECAQRLEGILHNAVDYSAAVARFRLAGSMAQDVLASGSGLDFRSQSFPKGSCKRTKLAGIVAMIVAHRNGMFELLVDRSYAKYLDAWLHDTAGMLA